MENKSVFETLNSVNVGEHIEKKNGLSYVSWAWAWAEALKRYPLATYKVYENKDEVFYFTDGRTCWVKTGVTINDIEHIEYLPVMDYNNKSIPLEKVTSFDVNKAIQRSLTKALARHGLGLYVYAGEDLPEEVLKGEPASTKPVEKKGISDELLKRCTELRISLDKVAVAYKKELSDLTDDDIKSAIETKEAALAAKAAKANG